jgi:nitroimidazol reductase NimA-like FMN-containing flavoprotein (pyridoxamine 5'-phosphate oxidase superfamily)
MAERRHLEVLTVSECSDLVREQEMGRLAIGAPHGPPFVAPVTFLLDGTNILFCTDAGEKLDAVDDCVSFQVDGFDHQHRTGWSVLIRGRIEIPDDAEVAHLDLHPWIGPRAFWIRLTPDAVTGRRVVLTLPEVDGRVYR